MYECQSVRVSGCQCVSGLVCQCVSCLVVLISGSQILNLPRVGIPDKWEIWLAASGPFVIRRAMGILTSARCVELVTLRRAGMTGDLTEYYQLCQSLPQVLSITANVVSIVLLRSSGSSPISRWRSR